MMRSSSSSSSRAVAPSLSLGSKTRRVSLGGGGHASSPESRRKRSTHRPGEEFGVVRIQILPFDVVGCPLEEFPVISSRGATVECKKTSDDIVGEQVEPLRAISVPAGKVSFDLPLSSLARTAGSEKANPAVRDQKTSRFVRDGPHRRSGRHPRLE